MSSSQPPHKLRIALLGTRGIPARYGGFETFAEQLSRRLAQRGHEVVVYGRSKLFEHWGELEPLGAVRRRSVPTIFHKYLETPVHALTSFIDLLPRPYDVALLCNAANSPFVPLLKLRRKPLVINVDGIERHRSKWNAIGKAWYMLGERCSVWFATKVVSDADVIADYYRQHYGCESVVIPYGTHPVRREPGAVLAELGVQAGKYLLYVSRLESENNALGVIRAYNKISTDMPLVVVGDAPYSHEYKAQLRREASEGVVFAGYRFGEAYEELQTNCYLYIQATEVGGTHPALVEAMSYGNCVIVNGTPENLEVVSNSGLSYAKNDFDELAERLATLIADPSKTKELGQKAKLRADQVYSWDAVVDRYERLFLELADK